MLTDNIMLKQLIVHQEASSVEATRKMMSDNRGMWVHTFEGEEEQSIKLALRQPSGGSREQIQLLPPSILDIDFGPLQ